MDFDRSKNKILNRDCECGYWDAILRQLFGHQAVSIAYSDSDGLRS